MENALSERIVNSVENTLQNAYTKVKVAKVVFGKTLLYGRLQEVRGAIQHRSNLVEEEILKAPISAAKAKLWSWLNGSLKIKMTDNRVLIGNFFCTDRDSNVILGSSLEYLKEEDVGIEQPRVLGLVMVPGRHIVSIHYGSDSLPS